MNVHVTMAAEGLARRAFTVAECERMVEVGIIDESERFELIGGEIVPMSPKGILHERLKSWLNYSLVRGLPDTVRAIPETTFRLSPDTFIEPDFLVYPTDAGVEGLSADTALLAIEIGVSSVAYDLGRKARLYSDFAIPELWVIDANAMQTFVHRKPSSMGYRDVQTVAADEPLTSLKVPGFSIFLKDHT